MDVLSIIKNEHREVSTLFDRADKLEPGDSQLYDVAKEIQQKLSLHLTIEERLFYARLRALADEQESQVDVFEAYTEHTVAKTLLDMLASKRKPDEEFKAQLQVLGESVKHHVEEEESKVFDVARSYLEDDERESIGEAWEAAKARKQNSSKKTTTRRKTTRGTTAASPRAKTRR